MRTNLAVKHVVKLGITVNYQTLETVNFNVMRDMEISEGPVKVSVNIPFKITRDTSMKTSYHETTT